MRLTFAVAMTLLFAPAASPDGAQASFPGENGRFALSWYHDTDVGIDTTDLATLDNTGDIFRVIVSCEYECHFTRADWSPNGRRLVYAADWDESEELDTQRAGGTGFRMIVRSARGFFSSPVWSPNGRRIAFAEYRWSDRAGHYISDIYVIHRDGTHLNRVTHTRRSEDQLDWSNRNLLVFEKRGELFTMRPNGERLRQLTDNDVVDGQPDWAPGGTRLTFVRSGEIWKMRASGENASGIASGHSPAWAPDGSLIAFVATADGAIHTVRPSGENDALIGDPVDYGSISGLDWQPR